MKIPLSKTYLFFILISLFSCHEDSNPCKLDETTLKDLAKVDSLTKLLKVRERNSIWLSNYKEPSLLSAQNETYRFFLYSSFGGVRVYRIEKIDGQYMVVVKTFEGYDTEQSIRKFSVSAKRWNNIVDQLAANGFWTYPSSIERSGLDGETWTLEGYKPIKDECTGKNYHRLTRWSPNDEKFIAMCSLLSSLKQE